MLLARSGDEDATGTVWRTASSLLQVTAGPPGAPQVADSRATVCIHWARVWHGP